MVKVLALSFLVLGCTAPQRAGDDAETDDSVETTGAEDPSDELPAVAGSDAASPREALLAEAERELAAMRSSHYEHHTRVDEATGLYDYDCSGFVGYALKRSAPAAWTPIAAQHRRPLAKHFEAFFAAPQAPWSQVDRAAQLVPGDVIAWIEPPENHSRNTGHIVIAAERPRARGDELVVRVIDSSHAGHGKSDARVREARNGLGTGDLVLHVGADGRADGYRWSTWKRSKLFFTPVAIGHLP